MREGERELRRRAGEQFGLCSRPEAISLNCSDHLIRSRLREGFWTRVHPGVYSMSPVPLDWKGRLAAAVLAAGPGSLASHRSAMILWGLEGIKQAPVEVTVPVNCGPVPAGVIVHRTRRRLPGATADGVAVTTVERTLLDLAGCLPAKVVEVAADSALRRRLTTVDRLLELMVEQSGRGVRGTRLLRRILAERDGSRPPGSPAETRLMGLMRDEGLPDPVTQYKIPLPDGSVAVTDFGWPWLMKAVEVDGLDAHGSAEALDHDLRRQNLILATGHQLRRYSARQIKRNPKAVVLDIRDFLYG